MRTVDRKIANASVAACFEVAADVERWPEILPHYRFVRYRRRDKGAAGLVEMAARRDFGPVSYPVWWVSEMRTEPTRPAVLYEHVDGITTGMDVVWSFRDVGEGRTEIEIVHDWAIGPHWPLPSMVRRAVADWIIGPIFIHHVASRTLAGVVRRAEALNPNDRDTG